MTHISTYLTSVITILITASFISLLLPKGETKKYVRFGTGLIVICLFANMISGVNIVIPDEINFDANGEYSQSQFEEQVKTTMQAKLEKEVTEKFNVSDIKITVGEDMKVKAVETSEQNKLMEIERYLGIETL